MPHILIRGSTDDVFTCTRKEKVSRRMLKRYFPFLLFNGDGKTFPCSVLLLILSSQQSVCNEQGSLPSAGGRACLHRAPLSRGVSLSLANGARGETVSALLGEACKTMGCHITVPKALVWNMSYGRGVGMVTPCFVFSLTTDN